MMRRLAILCHRWMGVAFCLLFGWWFVSGIFMLYWDYPGVDSSALLRHSPILDPNRIRLSPSEAFARLGLSEMPDSVRLNTLGDRPVYRFRVKGDEYLVSADSGDRPDVASQALSLSTAAVWTGLPAQTATLQLLTEPDQWTVPESFAPLRPLAKYSWPNGEDVYVSLVSGEVVQHTTRGSRLKAWLGPIPHWLYFTPLRKHLRLWTEIVIWASGLATVAALLGLVAGFWIYAPARRIPYTGQKRLHLILGLFFGIVACTWSFSGMLSMDPFPVRHDAGAARLASALRGGHFHLSAFDAKTPRLALGQLQAKELQLADFAGEPIYLAIGGAHLSRIIPVQGSPLDTFDQKRLFEVIRMAIDPIELRLVTGYDAYYLDRNRQKPLPVILARCQNSRYYVDPKTAQVVGVYESARWMERWLYHGLHSLDFPWLYQHRPAWDVVILTLLSGGAWLSFTAVILALRLTRRKFRKLFLNFSHT